MEKHVNESESDRVFELEGMSPNVTLAKPETSREKAWQLSSIHENWNGTCREGKLKNILAKSP